MSRFLIALIAAVLVGRLQRTLLLLQPSVVRPGKQFGKYQIDSSILIFIFPYLIRGKLFFSLKSSFKFLKKSDRNSGRTSFSFIYFTYVISIEHSSIQTLIAKLVKEKFNQLTQSKTVFLDCLNRQINIIE